MTTSIGRIAPVRAVRAECTLCTWPGPPRTLEATAVADLEAHVAAVHADQLADPPTPFDCWTDIVTGAVARARRSGEPATGALGSRDLVVVYPAG